MPPAPSTPSGMTGDLYGVSAGLDLVSGVFGYLDSLSASSIASSRADLIRAEATANAQRYSEQAAQFEAQEKVMYLSSGVKLSGSPIDALATTARVASENVQAIEMQGQIAALDQGQAGTEAQMKGRDLLIGGIASGIKQLNQGFGQQAPDAVSGANPAYGFGAITMGAMNNFGVTP